MSNVVPMAFAKFFGINPLPSDDPNSRTISMYLKKGQQITEEDIESIINFLTKELGKKVSIEKVLLKNSLNLIIKNFDPEKEDQFIDLIYQIRK